MNYNFSEKDWKLYRSKIAGWQEAYMERLCEEYMEILRSDDRGSPICPKSWSSLIA